MYTFISIVYVFVCLFLILVVLLQSGKGGGLGSAFGGDLHYEMLGPLVHKGLTLVRLGHSAA